MCIVEAYDESSPRYLNGMPTDEEECRYRPPSYLSYTPIEALWMQRADVAATQFLCITNARAVQ